MEIVIISVILLVIIGLVFLFKGLQSFEKASPGYSQRGELFSPAERSFFGVLERAVPHNIRVLGKVRVADVLTPESTLNRSEWQIAFKKISAKHFDYVLCDEQTLKVTAVVELDDKSHNSKKAKTRDALIKDACDSANLTLIRFPAKKSYAIEHVKQQVAEALGTEQITATVDKLHPQTPPDIINVEECKPAQIDKISTSKLAKKHGIKTQECLDMLMAKGFLSSIDGVQKLTEKGIRIGGVYVEKARLPAHFLWPEGLSIDKQD